MKILETAPTEPTTAPTKPDTEIAPSPSTTPQVNPDDPWSVPQPNVIPAPKA